MVRSSIVSATDFGSRCTPYCLYKLGQAACVVEARAIEVDLQDAARQVVVFDPGFIAQLAQHHEAVVGQVHHLDDVVPLAARQAFERELQSPAPLLPVELRPEQQRRVAAEPPLGRASAAPMGRPTARTG
jgi:hypothetical protein